jgi:Tol biopolymer transport system component
MIKKQIVLVTFLVLALLVGCGSRAPGDRSVTEGNGTPTVEPVVVDTVDATSSNDTTGEVSVSPTLLPTFTPVPPAPTEVPAEEPAVEGDEIPPTPIPEGPVDPLAGLIYQASNALWRIEADGQAVQIYDSGGGAVSPDGGQLLIDRDDDLWLVDLESGAEKNLTNTPDRIESGGRWGPTGSNWIAFGSKDATEEGPSFGHPSIITSDGNDLRVLEPESSSNAYPTFSPDGSIIAYDLGGSAWLYHIDAGRGEQLDLAYYGLSNPEGIKIGSPAWSPDGRMLAWMIGGGFGPDGDWRMGVALVDLGLETFQLLHPYQVLGGSGGWVPAPVWSPDGQWLAVTTMGERHRVDLWAVNIASQEEHDLGWAHSPVWSPDGGSLIFSQMPCEDVPCYEEAQIVEVRVGEWEPQVTALPAGSNPLAWVSSFGAGTGSALACPAESGPEALACDLQQALLSRDIAGLTSLMADPFFIGYWLSEGFSLSAGEAAAELDQYRLPADTSSLTFTTDRAQFPPLMGTPLDSMFGPDVDVALVVYSEGWGQDGLGAAMLFVVKEADGTYLWNGILDAPSVSNPPEEGPPADTTTWQSSLTGGDWVAEAMAVFPNEGGDYYRELVVSRLDQSLSWTLVQETELWALGYSLPVPLHFTQDGRYLYFTHRVTPDGCGLFAGGSDLQQVDLATGQINEIPATAGVGQALSPDDATLALVRRTPETTSLVLHDLLSGQEREMTLAEGNALQAGRLVWSPDGSSVVLTLAHEPCAAGWAHSIVQVDITTLTLTTLVEKDERRFWSTEWAENKIRLEDVQGNGWWLSLESGQIDPD